MNSGARTILFPVSDLVQAKKVFSILLGADPAQDSAYYVGFEVADQHIGLVPGAQGTGGTPYWHVDDIEARYDALIAAGAEEIEAIHDVGGGRRVASVKDADGNTVGLLQDPQ